MTNNIVIKGGHVIDGSGSPGTETNIAIKNDRIIEVGRNINEENAEVIEATGKGVTPGFIDIKTHSDWTLPLMPQAESKIYQAVTTEVIGHWGYSCAPVRPPNQLFQVSFCLHLTPCESSCAHALCHPG